MKWIYFMDVPVASDPEDVVDGIADEKAGHVNEGGTDHDRADGDGLEEFHR